MKRQASETALSDLITQLEARGSADAIAAYLERLDCSTVTAYCPIEIYLARHGYESTVIYQELEARRLPRGDWQKMPTPPYVRQFIARYDKGLYPGLQRLLPPFSPR
jgi:hypothetical protein